MKKNINITSITGIPFEQILIRHFSNEVQLRPEFIFFFLLEGTMDISIYEKTLSLNTHDIVFLKPFEVHAVLATSPNIHVLALFIHPSYLKTFCPDISEIYFERNYIRCQENDSLYTSLCTAIADIITYTIKTDAAARLKILSAISSILIQLMDALGLRKLETPGNDDYIRQRIYLLLDYLNNHFADKITLSSAAEVLGIHPQYFSAFFKKHFHTTFIDYLTALRINKTLPLLANTDESITSIALNHGFSNHKTYSMAFRKIHGITPSTYRKELSMANKNTLLSNQNIDYFSFFQRYWKSDNTAPAQTRVMQNHMTLSLSTTLAGKQTALPQHCFSIGRASAILRSDIQNQIQSSKDELQIKTIRLRDIFSDDLFVYYEDEEKRPIINWKYIDLIFDFLLALDIKPFPEIGFMPRALASKKQYAGWIYRPNVSIPKSFKKWSLLVADFISHLILRYGKKEVESWNFDFWTSANLKIKDGYWNESQQDFFLFYRVTYLSIKNIDENIKIGSPNFSIPSGIDWYGDFFDYCKEYGLEPSYISSHLYNCEDNIAPALENLSRFSTSWDDIGIVNTAKDTSIKNITALYHIMVQRKMEHLELVISDWNLSYIPRDLVRDTCFMAPYILYTTIQTRTMVKTLCFRSLSDVNEDFFIDQKPFHGGPGLMDFNGLKKASYYAFSLLARLGDSLLDTGANYLLAQSEKGFQLLLFHFVYYDSLYALDDHSSLSYKQRYNIYETSEELVIHSILAIPKGTYRIKETRIDRSCGSAYDLWLKTGAAEEMDASLIHYLRQKGAPDITYCFQECSGTLYLDTVLQPHGVTLLELEPIA